jgi:drug/metabolite transporter (DMT)-like permease
MPGAVLRAPAEHRSGIVLVTIGTIAWSSAGLFVRLLTRNPWTIIVWRSAFGTVFIGANVVRRHGRSTLGMLRQMGIGSVLVTLYSAATITLFVPALQNTSVAHAMTIYAALPFVVAGIARTWLGERPAARMLVASLVAMLGLVVMLGGPHSQGLRSGDLLAVDATLVSALMTVEARHSRDVEMLPVANLLAVLFALPFVSPVTVLSAHDLAVVAAFGLCHGARPGAVSDRFGIDPGVAFRAHRDTVGPDGRAMGLGRRRRDASRIECCRRGDRGGRCPGRATAGTTRRRASNCAGRR